MARGQEEWPERSGTRWGQWEGPPGPGEPLIRRISSLQGPWAGMIQGQLGSQELEDSWPQWQAKPLSCTQDPSASVREDLRDPGGPTNTLCISPLPPPSQHPVNRMFSLTPLRAMRCQRTSNPAPSPFHNPPPKGGSAPAHSSWARPLLAPSYFMEQREPGLCSQTACVVGILALCFAAVWSWATCLTSLCQSFLICEIGMITVLTSWLL